MLLGGLGAGFHFHYSSNAPPLSRGQCGVSRNQPVSPRTRASCCRGAADWISTSSTPTTVVKRNFSADRVLTIPNMKISHFRTLNACDGDRTHARPTSWCHFYHWATGARDNVVNMWILQQNGRITFRRHDEGALFLSVEAIVDIGMHHRYVVYRRPLSR